MLILAAKKNQQITYFITLNVSKTYPLEQVHLKQEMKFFYWTFSGETF